MRTDIQYQLATWLNSPECAQYVTTLCPADDLQEDDLADELRVLHSLTAAEGDNESTQALPMIHIESLPTEVRTALGDMQNGDDECGQVA